MGTGRQKPNSQDSRLRFYGGNIYGSIHWVPADTVINQHQEIDEDNKGPVGKIDRFATLPDDIIARHVFDKMSDSKSLCNFSMASKRFASLVPDTQTVTLKIPSWRPVCRCHPDPTARPPPFLSRLGECLFDFLTKSLNFAWWVLVYPFVPDCGTHYPDVIRTTPPVVRKFLKKFSCIKTLRIELSFLGVVSTPSFKPLIRWKFDKCGFVYVSAKSLEVGSDKDEDDVDEASVDSADRLTMAAAFDVLDSVWDHFIDGVWRIAFVDSILDSFPHLKDVLVMDCLGQGRVELDKEGIDGVKDIENALVEKVYTSIKVWHLPVVRLPISGCVMKEATLAIFKGDGIDDELLVENAFEEKEYLELARTIVKKDTGYKIKVAASEVNGRIHFVVG